MLKEKIEKYSIPEPNTGCWLWTRAFKGTKRIKCYGNVMHNGKNIAAHRLSFIAYNGEIPKDAWVLHKCDNPACVNPEHLFLGDRLTNVKDRKQKNRGFLDNGKRRGERHPRATLTWDMVHKIRELYVPYKMTCPMLAKQFNVGISAVELIVSNRTWKQ